MRHIQNNQKSIGKSIAGYGFKNLKKKNPPTKSLCKMFVISKKKTISYGMDLKINRKSIA
jgi:hypothetical protein